MNTPNSTKTPDKIADLAELALRNADPVEIMVAAVAVAEEAAKRAGIHFPILQVYPTPHDSPLTPETERHVTRTETTRLEGGAVAIKWHLSDLVYVYASRKVGAAAAEELAKLEKERETFERRLAEIALSRDTKPDMDTPAPAAPLSPEDLP